MGERAHIVQTVGKLYQKHPHITGDGNQEFTEIFGLFGLPGYQIEFGYFRKPVDK
jgi:hypothetical protein